MGNFDNGHIKIFRKMLDWEWFSDINTFYVFMYCLLKANWKDKKWRGIDVKRGSFITSRAHLAKDLHLSEQQIKTALEHLESTNEITKSTTARYTVITVVKYNEYQTSNQLNNQETTNKTTSRTTNNQPSSNQVATTTEESNKVRKKEKDKNKPPHPGWIPADSHDGIYVFSHPSSEGWRIEVVDGKEWGYQIEQ